MDNTDFDPVHVLETKTRELAQLQTELRKLKVAYEEAVAKPAPLTLPLAVGPLPTDKPSAVPDASLSSKEKKLKELASDDILDKLKEVFQQYACIQTITLMDKMELAQFRRFIKEVKLVPQVCSQAQADVFFFHKNRGKNVTFLRWVQILCEFAKIKYEAPSGSEALERLVNEVILTASAIRATQLPVTTWRERMEDAAMQLELRKAAPMLDSIYHTFCSLETGDNGMLPLDQYLMLTAECHLVPELLSKRDAVKIFRAVQRDSFSDLLSREEFYTSMACLSLQVFGERGNGEALSELMHWLEKSSQMLRVLALKKGRTNTK